MTTRNRLTWQRRQASPPPASYGWTPEHPAAQPDPDASQYENGDTSSWAEDPTKGPYPQGPAPASYGWTPEHPAAKPDAGGSAPSAKQAADIRARVEQKALKCVRLASAILGKTASVNQIEAHALTLMAKPDRQIEASMIRLRQAFLTAEGPFDGMDTESLPPVADQNAPFMAEEAPLAPEAEDFLAEDFGEGADPEAEDMLNQMMAEEAPEGPEDPEAEALLASMLNDANRTAEEEKPEDKEEKAPETDKTAEANKTAEGLKMAMEAIEALKAEIATLKAGKGKQSDELDDDFDPMNVDDSFDPQDDVLADLFGKNASKKKAKKAKKAEPEEEDDAEDEEVEEEDDSEDEEVEDEPKASKKAGKGKGKAKKSDEIEFEDEPEDEPEEEPKKAGKGKGKGKQAYTNIFAEDEGEDDDEPEDDEGEDDEGEDDEEAPKASKSASLRPQMRKASKGPRSLGNVTASGKGRDRGLENIWKSAPDVSDHF